VLLGRNGRLPVAEAGEGQACWRAAAELALPVAGQEPELLGWAGDSRANRGEAALAFRAGGVASAAWSDPERLAPDEARLVDRARRLLGAAELP